MNTILTPKTARSFVILAAALALGLAACAQPAATPEPALPPPAIATEPPEAAAPTQPPAEAPAEEGSPAEPAPAAEAGSEMVVWTLASDGNEARYLVNEQLANLDFPTDAIGVTRAVSGQIAVRADGSVVAEQSRFTVDLTTLVSDRDMRDRFVQRNTLQTSSFPTVEFTPTAVSGLPAPLPETGEVAFQLMGEMTLHGVTQAVTWNVTGEVNGGTFTGTASTSFPFDTFGLTIPRVMSVLSVEDNIRLEYDFNLVQAG